MSLVAAMVVLVASAKNVNYSFTANGYTSKAKIEAAAKSVKGVRSAVYNSKTKKVTVCYDNKLTTRKKVKSAVSRIDVKTAAVKKNTTSKTATPAKNTVNTKNNNTNTAKKSSNNSGRK